MADREVPGHRELLQLNIGVLERVGTGKVVLKLVLDVAVDAAFHEEACPPELRAVADAAKLSPDPLVRAVDGPVVHDPTTDFQFELAIGRVEPQPALPVGGQKVLLADLLLYVRNPLWQRCGSAALLFLGLGLNHQITVLLLADLPVGFQNIQNFCGHIPGLGRSCQQQPGGNKADAKR